MLAASLLTAALLLAMSRTVEAAPFGDWWLPILLFVVGIGVILLDRFGWRLAAPAPAFDVESEAPERAPLPVGGVPEIAPLQPAPINTMFIRPERAIERDAPTTAVDQAAVEAKPSPGFPGEPAVTPGFTARTEQTPAEAAATKDAPATPPPATAEVEQPRPDPVIEAVVEKTAAPQQPYETENMGVLTPAEVDKVVSGEPSETAAKVTEPAPEELTAPDAPVGSADDLQIIDGIGPKIAAALRAAGIDSFQKLANATEGQLQAILTNANVRYPGTTLPYWAQQAAYAARQDWDGFKKYNAERKRGGDD